MLATMLIFPETTLVVVVVVGQHTKKNPPQFIKVQELMDVNGTQKESLQMGFNNRGWHFIHIFSSQCHWGQDDRSWHLAYWEGNLRERSTRVAEPQSHLWVLLGFTSQIFPYRAHFTHEALVAAVGESRWNWQRSLWLYHLPGAATVSWLWAVARVRTWDEGRHSFWIIFDTICNWGWQPLNPSLRQACWLLKS